MKAVVLSGGTGSRLRPVTHTVPKQLLPLANKPVLDYVIEDLRSAGISEIGVVLGGDHPEQIQSYLGSGDAHGVEITYIMQGEPLGLAHAVGCAKDFVGDSPFVVYFGDTLVDCGLTKQLINSFDSGTHEMSLTLQEVKNPSRYGVASFENNELVEVQEKPENPPSNYAYVGVLVLTPKAFDIIANQTPSWRGELELTETIGRIVENRTEVNWTSYEGLWIDVGTPSDAIDANREMLDRHVAHSPNAGSISVGDGTEIAKSANIRGPVLIGNDVTIGPEASIGPYTSVADGSQIDRTQIESSIIMQDCSIDCERPITESILGPKTELKHSSTGELHGVVGQDTNLTL